MMAVLPVIVSFGGINAAGRSSFHHGYRRMVHEALDPTTMLPTWQDLAGLMNLDASAGITPELIEQIKNGTLIRRIEQAHYDPAAIYYQRSAQLKQPQGFQFTVKRNQLPEQMPETWQVTELGDGQLQVTVQDQLNVMVPGHYEGAVSSAGQLPSGFDPASLYNSRHHPRALTMTVYGASDAIQSMGMDWQEVLKHIRPDQVSVYSGSSVAQVDNRGMAGLFQAPITGSRISSKMMPLSLAEMSADFINSYLLNSVGSTGTSVGACATYLYNLRQGVMDIQSGRARVALVGSTDAPVVPEIMEGFGVMGALANDDQIRKLDQSETVNNRRACRPFSSNCGFTMAESAQFMILMDDQLALELGANIHGSVADVFVNADANKKSISAPGVGNYVTMAKATALAKKILGDEGLQRTFVQAHGTGTPQNRVTESHILNEVAQTFGIQNWSVSAMKAYVGHSLGPAAADQIIPSLGVWAEGYIPGIKTIDHIADDVHQSNLDILMDHKAVGIRGEDMLGAVINSKGFGGNNASALILSPQQTTAMLAAKHGNSAVAHHARKNEHVAETAIQYDQSAIAGKSEVIYKFGESVMTEKDVEVSTSQLKLSEFVNEIDLASTYNFDDYLES